MTDKEFKEAKKVADELEDKIAAMHFSLEYVQIAKLAEFAATEIRTQIPMYIGNLNPKWKLYNYVVALLIGRVNGG